MNETSKKRICRHCREAFEPAPQAYHRQKFCGKPECRKASQVTAYQEWRIRHPDEHEGRTGVLRMQEWRKEFADRERRRRAERRKLQKASDCATSAGCGRGLSGRNLLVLPNVLHNPDQANALVVGLIAHVFGCVLPNEIATVTRKLISKGAKILAKRPETE